MEENRIDAILKLIAEETGFPREQLTTSVKIEDLGIDSLDFVSLIQSISEKFKEIPDSEIAGLHSVGDIVRLAQ